MRSWCWFLLAAFFTFGSVISNDAENHVGSNFNSMVNFDHFIFLWAYQMSKIKLHKNKPEDVKRIATYLGQQFVGDPSKITYWLMTENLNFGGCSPAHLIMVGKADKVREFIDGSSTGVPRSVG